MEMTGGYQEWWREVVEERVSGWKSMRFFENREKIVLKFGRLKNFRLLCTSIGNYMPM